MTIQITILGLGKIGTSVGLALREHKDMLRRVGNDRDAMVARQAEKMGALDQISFNLPSAVKQADIIFISESLVESKDTLEVILPDLKPGAVILDASLGKNQRSEWISEVLPPERYYVSITPTINPRYLSEANQNIEAAHADLFQQSLMLVCAPFGTHPEAIKLSTDLIGLLGAAPLFADPSEIDGLLAASSLLPQISAAAMLLATTHQPGWNEIRKVNGPEYFASTSSLGDLDSIPSLVESIRANRDNVIRTLDDYVRALETLQAALQDQDDEGLRANLVDAAQAKETWLQQRQTGRWETENIPQNTTQNDFLGRILGIHKRPDEKK